jgi:AcrR family transcriptional regulator
MAALTFMASKIRGKIVEHAITCFAAFGYRGCGTKLIADSANVTEGSLFRLFLTKEKLFEEALELARAKMLPQADFVRLLNTGEFSTGIHRALTAMHKRLTHDGVRISRFALLERTESSREILRPLADARVRAIANRIRVAMKSGVVRKGVDPNCAASFIYFAVRNLPFDALFFSRQTRAQQQRMLVEMIDAWLHGVLRK